MATLEDTLKIANAADLQLDRVDDAGLSMDQGALYSRSSELPPVPASNNTHGANVEMFQPMLGMSDPDLDNANPDATASTLHQLFAADANARGTGELMTNMTTGDSGPAFDVVVPMEHVSACSEPRVRGIGSGR